MLYCVGFRTHTHETLDPHNFWIRNPCIFLMCQHSLHHAEMKMYQFAKFIVWNETRARCFILSFFTVCNLSIKDVFERGLSHLSWDMGIVSQKYLEGYWGDVNPLMKSLTISRCCGGANNLLYHRPNSTISWHLWGVPNVGLVFLKKFKLSLDKCRVRWEYWHSIADIESQISAQTHIELL